MPRSVEVIRQWTILRALDAARLGITIQRLAEETGATTRTIRRDLDALTHAGFPITSEKINGTAHWKLSARPFRTLTETGFSFTELCALYFSRSLLETMTGTPFAADLRRAFERLEAALPARARRYLDRLPALVGARPEPRKRQRDRRTPERIARLLDASYQHRRVAMRYNSFSSRRVKDYVVDPYRLFYAFGGIYLRAWVDEYTQIRTFAIERIMSVLLLDQHFTPRPEPHDPFRHSLGVSSALPERVEIEFDARVADYVRERDWHPSQRLRDMPDGSLVLTLDVGNDYALRSWILSFGPLARVASPAALADQILDELEAARQNYAPRMDFEGPALLFDDLDAQRRLPFAQSS